MTSSAHTDSALVESLVAQLRAMREAERRLFGALDPVVRDAPIRPDDWSPKDHQAHLTAWKARQTARLRSARLGEPYPVDDREEDAINAELQKLRAGWTWEAIVAEADDVSDAEIAEVRALGEDGLRASERLIGGIFGNGPFHAATHFGWLVNDGVGMQSAAVEEFLDEEERLLAVTALPERDRATGVYNLACAHAIAGRLDKARALLREAFRGRPDLAEFARDDPDLVELRGELDELSLGA